MQLHQIYRIATAALLAGLLPFSVARASPDMGCDPVATLRLDSYQCGGVPVLTPSNDTRINAMLLMAESRQLSHIFPDPKSVPSADRVNQLVVPFAYNFNGWIYIGQKGANADGPDSGSSDAPSDNYADGEGSICRNEASGAKAFTDALKAANGIPAGEIARLNTARADVAKTCAANATGAAWKSPADIRSLPGQQFAVYLEGADAFYRHDFVSAAKAFGRASHSANPWLKETALYMVARAQLNAAQANAFSPESSAAGLNFDNMTPDRSKVAKVLLDAAGKALHAYLQAYPHGRYALSAAGLQRRIAWLAGNTVEQANLYAQAFAHWSPATSNVPLLQLANELDNKLPLALDTNTAPIHSPKILAVLDLMRMRGQTDRKPLTLAELGAQKSRFASDPALYDYLLAAWHIYVGHQPKQALALLPQKPVTPLDYFGLSQQMLRGFALEDSGQASRAQQLWTSLIPLAQYRFQRETLELALAINLEQAGLVDQAFAHGSPVQNEGIRAVMLQSDANANLLRAQAKNRATSARLRDIALYVLLYKELTRGHYANFIADLALIPDQSSRPSERLKPFAQSSPTNDDGYACPAVRDVAAILQRHADDPKGLNCLAGFVRKNRPDYGLAEPYVIPSEPASPTRAKMPPTLGSAPSQFGGKIYYRISSYQKVIDNAHAPASDRAYALSRAIRCFAPAGSSECGGNDIPAGTRRQWFRQLKSAYPHNRWAQDLKYYW